MRPLCSATRSVGYFDFDILSFSKYFPRHFCSVLKRTKVLIVISILSSNDIIVFLFVFPYSFNIPLIIDDMDLIVFSVSRTYTTVKIMISSFFS